MNCNRCGTKLGSACRFCPECGAPQIQFSHRTPGVVPPSAPYARGSVDFILEGITAVLFGLSLIGGGSYALIKLTGYTRWVILGGLSSIIAGVSCAARGGSQIYRFMKKHGESKNV